MIIYPLKELFQFVLMIMIMDMILIIFRIIILKTTITDFITFDYNNYNDNNPYMIMIIII